MLSFADIQQSRGLKRFISSALGTLYRTPTNQPPIQVVRHFDSELSPAMIPVYVDVIRAIGEWVAQHPMVSRWIQVNQPLEVGLDYVMRGWEIYYYSLNTYDTPAAEDEDQIPIPDEVESMRRVVRDALSMATDDERSRILTAIIERSLLGPSGKTYLAQDDGPFVVVEPKVTADEIRRWASLADVAQ
jgi:hypothetical protein